MSLLMMDRVNIKDKYYEEFKEWWARQDKYTSEHPDFKELKSAKLYRIGFGGIVMGGFVLVREFDTIADLEKLSMRLFGENGNNEFQELEGGFFSKAIIPGSQKTELWTDNIVP